MQTNLHKSPFYILTVNSRSNRSEIFEKTEEMSLLLDPEICSSCQTLLTNPRNRLATEIEWLPGLSPNKAKKFLTELESKENPLNHENNMPQLAKANLVSAYIEIMISDENTTEIENLIKGISDISEDLNIQDIQKDLNADRNLSDFPQITDTETLKELLTERKLHYRNVARNFLDLLPAAKLVKTMTNIVNLSTKSGTSRAKQLIHDLVDQYEIETNQVLSKEETQISALVKDAEKNIDKSEKVLKKIVDDIEKTCRNWDFIAQPIQLIYKSSGKEHRSSVALANQITNLSVSLFNQHRGLDNLCKQLLYLSDELFIEVPKAFERNKKLLKDISEIEEKEKEQKLRQKKLDEELNYEAEIGLIFKDKIKITSKDIHFNDLKIDLNDIINIRYGAISNSVNGIPTGTDYTIHVSASKSKHIIIQTKKKSVYENITQRLWKTVCWRILVEYCDLLRQGKTINVGDLVFNDTHVTLIKQGGYLTKNEDVVKKWGEVTISTHNGSFYIWDKNDKKTYFSLSFKDEFNVHILYNLVSGSFEKWTGRLSSFLEG